MELVQSISRYNVAMPIPDDEHDVWLVWLSPLLMVYMHCCCSLLLEESYTCIITSVHHNLDKPFANFHILIRKSCIYTKSCKSCKFSMIFKTLLNRLTLPTLKKIDVLSHPVNP